MKKHTVLLLITLILTSACSALKPNLSNSKPTVDLSTVGVPLKTINIVDINSQSLYNDYTANYYYGIKMALAEINQQGGVNGIKLNLIKQNDYSSYVQAYQTAKAAHYANNPTVFIGATSYYNALGVAHYANQNYIPYLITGTSSENILLENTNPAGNFVFRVKEGYLVHVKAIVNKLASNKSINSVAIFTYANSEGDYLYKAFKTAIHKASPRVKVIADIRKAKDLQNDAALKEIRDTPANAVIIALDGPDIENFALVAQRYRLLLNKQVYIMFAGEPEWLDSLGYYTPKGWVATGFPWYAINSDNNKQFVAQYQAKYKIKPRYSSYIGYSTIYLIAQALKNANYGTDCKVNSVACRTKLANAMQSVSVKTKLLNVSFYGNKTNIGTYIGTLQPFNTKINKYKQVIEKLDIRMFNSEFVSGR